LSVLTMAVAILSAVFSTWGMNFAVIPLANARKFAAVAGPAVIGLLGLVAWRRGWM
jgi:Mg2+ and Co2+ transporter CorA